ncbi:hypothetical protein BC940DRAFT_328926 [Gongronella butleri]|nr:hypothetical protein BC940DRAFT_328926 [Gongronella butleri]
MVGYYSIFDPVSMESVVEPVDVSFQEDFAVVAMHARRISKEDLGYPKQPPPIGFSIRWLILLRFC